MAKQKTKKTIAKRFKITGTGKVLRGHQYSRHLRATKSKRRIRSFKRPVVLSHQQASAIKKLINR
ncbi:50S ribosomal protein L35 [Candidatus Gottesmanbacteria bacterium RIFCSPHIGHO2_02_FULL_40_24]|uniref:Large ribosomal subunit protein bL35 n=1 Tax=Candidatus Gottesmanbacteria bacterium RIFCSPHIGHO2_01_FULL_40_15 TaxID=1798376 RepID=A0A1F5Z3A1_9BACT|nr:MAG: 50S ribosomal protein L35 [Candidatus Gottesmanbacteria bacterium RIFCSPHIGHO2_01_FULL_40_15]OGG17197.1 MAG: 50S ribosomal protein L35 [Candidatus Gottesmanbacteria bacterium RIFCSPHIGHO2_02_FULL_40_24]OGG21239.1 MAG: 50S ribosomal protein L35 [Candidatus Gottesmanbacteria bacterium RIFCSPLOWO2_01_FULL_40_10]OGG23591.1 MAG: 50S ribosomal protein L35 [Candidatus Gottesmanbacteria bacterium RIFCSPHIGHO2_12_FULL_40_13]OGG32229.1 MAG: 50S ribosomal protein L35 [Candidatus Gottesmanbacteria 